MKKFLLTILPILIAFAGYGQRTIKGKITDAKGDGLISATILAKEVPTLGTLTDLDGNYELKVPNEVTAIVVSYTGYATREINLNQGNVYDVTLAAGQILDELVVVGYGTKSARYNTQSTAVLNNDKIKNRPALGPQELLQGQAAGVQMTNSSGVLGAQANIRVRGAASISGGGQPLFVVDGVPLNDDARTSTQGGGSSLNPLLNIPAADIESMTVLKDAAAAAIYGSRGSNGVVIIKTKRGTKGEKTKINLDYFAGQSEATNVLGMMNAAQYKEYDSAWRTARGLAPINIPNTSFDWVDAVVRKGTSNNINLSASGGSEKTTYFIGGSFVKESGFTIGNDSRRLTGRFNFDHKANDWLAVGANVSISKVDMDRIGTENNTFAPLTSSYLQLPNVVPRDSLGNLLNTGFIQNVIAIEQLNDNFYGTRRTLGNVYADITLMKGLVFRTDWGMDDFGNTEKTRVVNLITPGGTASRSIFNDNKWLTTNSLKYDKDFATNSSFSLFGAYSYETSRYLGIAVAGSGFANDELRNVNSAATPTTTNEEGSIWALESQFGTANLNLGGKYLFEGTIRRDGSSRFGANNRYGTFWAGSAGYILSEEAFMKNQKIVSFLKLTASYGISGNDRIGNFSSPALYGGGTLSDYNSAAGLRPIQTPNPDLSWESTAQLDFGIASKFLDNRISLNLNYYEKNTSDLLLNVPLPFTTGFASVSQNIGKMQNRGVDVELNVDVISKQNFSWSVGLNGGFVRNRVIELNESAAVDELGNKFIGGSAAQRAVVGKSLNEFYMVRANGVNPTTGDFEWLDKDGKPTTTYSAANRVYVGSAIPKFTGGFNTSVSYKGLDFSALFNFTYGNNVLIDGLRFTDNLNAAAGFNKRPELLNFWKESGQQAYAPKLNSTTAISFNQLSTLHLQNGSFLRLRNVQLGYTIPSSALKNQSILGGARIYVMGQNLWLLKSKSFVGPDPEVSANGASNLIFGESFFALPQARVVTAGISLNF